LKRLAFIVAVLVLGLAAPGWGATCTVGVDETTIADCFANNDFGANDRIELSADITESFEWGANDQGTDGNPVVFDCNGYTLTHDDVNNNTILINSRRYARIENCTFAGTPADSFLKITSTFQDAYGYEIVNNYFPGTVEDSLVDTDVYFYVSGGTALSKAYFWQNTFEDTDQDTTGFPGYAIRFAPYGTLHTIQIGGSEANKNTFIGYKDAIRAYVPEGYVGYNTDCTAAGVPEACCTGLRTGTCTAADGMSEYRPYNWEISYNDFNDPYGNAIQWQIGCKGTASGQSKIANNHFFGGCGERRVVTGWTQHAGNVYKVSMPNYWQGSGNPGAVGFDGVEGTKVADHESSTGSCPGDLANDKDYCWWDDNGGTMYVYSTAGDPDTAYSEVKVTLTDRNNCIQSQFMQDLLVENNVFEDGIETESCDGAYFIDDWMATDDVYISRDTVIRYNKFDGSKPFGCSGSGVSLFKATGSLVYGNIFIDNDRHISVGDGDDDAPTDYYYIYNNTFISTNDDPTIDGDGIAIRIRLYDDTNVEVKNNIIWDNVWGIYIANDNDGTLTETNNLFFANTTDDIYDGPGTQSVTLGTGAVESDPELWGYEISEDSPCKDAGTNPWSDGDGDKSSYNGIEVWDDDTDTVTAPGGTIDIGAWERPVLVRSMSGVSH